MRGIKFKVVFQDRRDVMHILIKDEQIKEMLKEVIVELLKERNHEFAKLLIEAIEDYLLGKAIEEGLSTNDVSKEEVFRILNEMK